MAVLSDADRVAVWKKHMANARRETGDVFGALDKADIRAAVDALDDFLDTNAAAINQAIPQPARAELTAPQKALLLQYVIERRYLRGS